MDDFCIISVSYCYWNQVIIWQTLSTENWASSFTYSPRLHVLRGSTILGILWVNCLLYLAIRCVQPETVFGVESSSAFLSCLLLLSSCWTCSCSSTSFGSVLTSALWLGLYYWWQKEIVFKIFFLLLLCREILTVLTLFTGGVLLWLLVWRELLTEKVPLMSNWLQGPALYVRAVYEHFQCALGSWLVIDRAT